MTIIKEVNDLVLILEKRISDRKTLDLLFPIKDKITEIERENLDLERNHFRCEQELHKEMSKLKDDHDKETSKLQSKNDHLSDKLLNADNKMQESINKPKKKGLVKIIST